MATLKRLVEILKRAQDGPPCTVHEWEMQRIPTTVKKYLKKYDLEKKFTSVLQDPDQWKSGRQGIRPRRKGMGMDFGGTGGN